MHRTRYSAPIEPGIVAGGCQALHTGTSKAHAFLSQNNRIADSPLFLTRQPDPRHDGSGYGFSYCWRPAAAAWRLWAWFTGVYWSAHPRQKWRAASPFSSPFPPACCWQVVGCFCVSHAPWCVRDGFLRHARTGPVRCHTHPARRDPSHSGTADRRLKRDT